MALNLHTCGSMSDDENELGDESESKQLGTPDSSALIIESDDLLQGRREVWIRHGSEMYRLRQTTAGKLYLSK